MENNIETAFMLLTVGLTAVLLVLATIVVFGKYLILAINKFSPDEINVEEDNQKPQAAVNFIAPSTIEAITSAINTVSGGKSKVTRIEKL